MYEGPSYPFVDRRRIHLQGAAFLRGVDRGDLDYLVIDLPPGKLMSMGFLTPAISRWSGVDRCCIWKSLQPGVVRLLIGRFAMQRHWLRSSVLCAAACVAVGVERSAGDRTTPSTLASVAPLGIARGTTAEMTVEGLNLAKSSAIY